jgi:hypothetical protein
MTTTTDAPSYEIQRRMIANVITMFIPEGKKFHELNYTVTDLQID